MQNIALKIFKYTFQRVSFAFLSYNWSAFGHLMVTQEFVINNNQTLEERTHTWVLKSWVGSLGASSMILSMLETYLEGNKKDMKHYFTADDEAKM